jgi:hypothetical protein
MPKVNYLAVVVASVAAFAASAILYSPLLFGKVWTELRSVEPGAIANVRPPAGEMIGEFVKTLVIAYVLARFFVLLEVVDWKGAPLIGVWLWIAI